MPEDLTTIQVSVELWRELKDRKEWPGESFEDVIWNLLDDEEDAD
ncbi:MAG: hypothetical protein ABEI86_09185 [Halobacteriaceae archaeon]